MNISVYRRTVSGDRFFMGDNYFSLNTGVEQSVGGADFAWYFRCCYSPDKNSMSVHTAFTTYDGGGIRM